MRLLLHLNFCSPFFSIHSWYKMSFSEQMLLYWEQNTIITQQKIMRLSFQLFVAFSILSENKFCYKKTTRKEMQIIINIKWYLNNLFVDCFWKLMSSSSSVHERERKATWKMLYPYIFRRSLTYWSAFM